MKTKKLRLIFLLLFIIPGFLSVLSAQYSLEQAIADTRRHSPIANLSDLLQTDLKLSNEILSRRWWPQIQVAGQASYQSETSGIDLSFPGIEIPRLTKDQYRIQADFTQPLYDGGLTAAMKKGRYQANIFEQNAASLEIEVAVDQSIQVFFLAKELSIRLKQTDLALSDMDAVIRKADAALANGTMLRSEWRHLSGERLKLNQHRAEVAASLQSALESLTILTGKEISDESLLTSALPTKVDSETNNDAPFIKQFAIQKELIFRNHEIEDKAVLPRLSAFAQTGYGKPGLNFLKNEFDPYYLVGIKFMWSLSTFYTRGKQRQLRDVAAFKINARQEAMDNAIKIRHSRFLADYERLQSALPVDEEIVTLRRQIRETAEVQLINGTISTSEFILKTNDVNEAELSRELNKLYLLRSAYLMQNILGWL
ncbi:MAG: TolC family protein [Saprospiraceae bacterium]|nr:TolC family protein [Saprospiraceae bacterium]